MEFETKGNIYAISKDKKSISILGNWYHNYNELDLNKGDEVKIVFTEKKVKGKDGKEMIFKNIKSIERIEIEEIKETKNNEEVKMDITVKPKYISDTTINCILMQSIQHSLNKGYALDKATYEVLQSYKKIIESI
jgi:hypothetical protein